MKFSGYLHQEGRFLLRSVVKGIFPILFLLILNLAFTRFTIGGGIYHNLIGTRSPAQIKFLAIGIVIFLLLLILWARSKSKSLHGFDRHRHEWQEGADKMEGNQVEALGPVFELHRNIPGGIRRDTRKPTQLDLLRGKFYFSVGRNNFLFWLLIIIIALAALALAFWLVIFIFYGLKILFSAQFFIQHNFSFSLVLTLIILVWFFIAVQIDRQTWSMVGDLTSFAGVPAVSVGGAGFLAMSDKLQADILKVGLNYSQLSIRHLEAIFLSLVLLILLSRLFIQLGKAISGDREGKANLPKPLFIPVFVISWISNLGLCTLLLNTIIVSLIAIAS